MAWLNCSLALGARLAIKKTKAFALPCLLRGVTAVILGSHELVIFCYYYLKEEILAGHYEKGWGHVGPYR